MILLPPHFSLSPTPPALRPPPSRRASVLIVVLAVSALIGAIAIGIAYRTRIEGERVLAERERAQAGELAEAALLLAETRLLADDPAVDAGRDPWAAPVEIRWSVGTGTARVTDESARFPLHALFTSGRLLDIGWKTRLDRLVATLRLPPRVVATLIDFQDADDEIFPGGAEDAVYAAKAPPRRAPNRPFLTLDELPFVDGLDETSAARLAAVTTIHGEPRININTAPPEVLAALDERIGELEIARIVNRRSFTPFQRIEEIVDVLQLDNAALAELGRIAGVASNVFRIEAEGRSGATSVMITTIGWRQDGDFVVKYRRVE
jgi:general secretion pathway protein K